MCTDLVQDLSGFLWNCLPLHLRNDRLILLKNMTIVQFFSIFQLVSFIANSCCMCLCTLGTHFVNSGLPAILIHREGNISAPCTSLVTELWIMKFRDSHATTFDSGESWQNIWTIFYGSLFLALQQRHQFHNAICDIVSTPSEHIISALSTALFYWPLITLFMFGFQICYECNSSWIPLSKISQIEFCTCIQPNHLKLHISLLPCIHCLPSCHLFLNCN